MYCVHHEATKNSLSFQLELEQMLCLFNFIKTRWDKYQMHFSIFFVYNWISKTKMSLLICVLQVIVLCNLTVELL